jgi:hypothetical protein
MPRLSSLFVLPVLTMLLGSSWMGAAFSQSNALSFVEYQGHRVQLSRTYLDFDEYKEAVGNINPKQALQVEAIMRKVRFGPSFANGKTVDDALLKLQFPGYGMFYANQLGARIDPTLELAYVEIPLLNRNRYFVLEKVPTGGFRVIADFIASSNPEITRVRRAKGEVLEFIGSNGKKIVPKSE